MSTDSKPTDVIKAIEKKEHIQYLCYMMLRRLNEAVPLRELIESGRFGTGQELVDEFFGSPDADDESGCSEAGGHTIESLLSEWVEATDTMMRMISGSIQVQQVAEEIRKQE